MFRYHPVCKCGSVRMDYEFCSFPMTWTASCHACGEVVLRCDLKLDKPPPPKAASKPYGGGGWVDDSGNYHSGR